MVIGLFRGTSNTRVIAFRVVITRAGPGQWHACAALIDPRIARCQVIIQEATDARGAVAPTYFRSGLGILASCS